MPKPAPYQIDQSGKIEDTARNTFLALANGKTIVLKINATEKRKLIRTIKRLTIPGKATYVYEIFAMLVFILLQEVKPKEVLIDTEYLGHDADIKNVMLQLFTKRGLVPPEIDFGHIGKKSSAHLAAIETFRGKRKEDLSVKAEGILGMKKGWRPRSSRGNP